MYARFADERERNRHGAWRRLVKDLARVGGSICACGMTGEVKEMVTTLLLAEKFLPASDKGEREGPAPIVVLSEWLQGKGAMEGEFDIALNLSDAAVGGERDGGTSHG